VICHCRICRERWFQRFVVRFWIAAFIAIAVGAILGLCSCGTVRPQSGGGTTTTLGGGSAPTTVRTDAPENPQTPTTTTVEKTTERTYEIPPTTDGSATASVRSSDREHSETAPSSDDGSRGAPVAAPSTSSPHVLHERTVERSTTTIGTAQKDTARELGARLANLRGVMWVGVLLLIGGPIVGWKLGWFTNGCIAGGVGLLLIILATVIPGNEAWFGLFGLLAIPVVAFVYYRAHHDARAANPFLAANQAAPSSSSTPPAA